MPFIGRLFLAADFFFEQSIEPTVTRPSIQPQSQITQEYITREKSKECQLFRMGTLASSVLSVLGEHTPVRLAVLSNAFAARIHQEPSKAQTAKQLTHAGFMLREPLFTKPWINA